MTDLSLGVWLWPDIEAGGNRVIWLWTTSWEEPESRDWAHLPELSRVHLEHVSQQQRIEGAVLPPGAVPLLKGETAATAGLRLLDEQPERLARGLIRVHQTDTLNAWHYAAAEAALLRAGVDVAANADARIELARALRAECCRIRVPENATLDELNAAAADAIERVSGEPIPVSREKATSRPLYWWAENSANGIGHELRWPRALASELHRRNMRLRPGLPVPLATAILRSRVEQPEQTDGRLMHRAEDGTVRSAGALVRLTQRALESTAPDGVVPLAAYLATVAYEQRRLGLSEADSRRVVIPSLSRDGLRRFGLATEAQLRTCLEWLQAVQLGPDSWPCVTGHGRAEAPRASTARGGRPAAPGYIVEVGYPLAPFAVSKLKTLYEANGWRVPSESSFYAPVLPLDLYPGPAHGSYTPTHKRQLDAYCMALPLVLMERRDEYAARGVHLDELRGPLKRVGIYERSHASLVENLCDAWRTEPPPSLPGMGRTAPVLVPVEPDDGHGSGTRYRFGPDFEHADSMIRDAAAFTEQQSKAGRLGVARKMVRRTK